MRAQPNTNPALKSAITTLNAAKTESNRLVNALSAAEDRYYAVRDSIEAQIQALRSAVPVPPELTPLPRLVKAELVATRDDGTTQTIDYDLGAFVRIRSEADAHSVHRDDLARANAAVAALEAYNNELERVVADAFPEFAAAQAEETAADLAYHQGLIAIDQAAATLLRVQCTSVEDRLLQLTNYLRAFNIRVTPTGRVVGEAGSYEEQTQAALGLAIAALREVAGQQDSQLQKQWAAAVEHLRTLRAAPRTDISDDDQVDEEIDAIMALEAAPAPDVGAIAKKLREELQLSACVNLGESIDDPAMIAKLLREGPGEEKFLVQIYQDALRLSGYRGPLLDRPSAGDEPDPMAIAAE